MIFCKLILKTPFQKNLSEHNNICEKRIIETFYSDILYDECSDDISQIILRQIIHKFHNLSIIFVRQAIDIRRDVVRSSGVCRASRAPRRRRSDWIHRPPTQDRINWIFPTLTHSPHNSMWLKPPQLSRPTSPASCPCSLAQSYRPTSQVANSLPNTIGRQWPWNCQTWSGTCLSVLLTSVFGS